MDPQVLVIFGASGDLARRKLIPALHSLHIQKRLPVPFAILGIGRTPLQDDSFREEMRKVLPAPVDPDFLTNLYFTSLDTENFDVYSQLRSRLDDLCSALKIPHNIVYYLAVPPGLSERIPQWLAALKMQDESDGHKRIVMEKPFGHDLQSAQALNRSLLSHWTEHQVYRIDHFLGKETVQNLLVFRFANEIFDSLWNHRYVDYVEITAAENLGVGTRAGYFDHTGIVRDMVQNHLLQVLAMVAMDPPLNFDADCVRHETMKVFKSLRPLQEADFEQQVVFGQYEAAHVKEGILPGYLQEPGIAHISRTETFAALKIFVDHPRWFNVPFYLRTGKRMPTRVTEVVLHFKKTPHPAFGIHGGSVAAQNQLVLRIQPDEG
ncbi:MAG TPA: glucose-6-phosphate dehydrogenase, partial [Fibrobacteraceae bacterium]|nr:glucose-6-phosphate dehydrogenase [Fibrobacteraceae bacterium]